jgi:hypothetical protein
MGQTNDYGGTVQYASRQQFGDEGSAASVNEATMVAGYPVSAYLQRPSTNGGYAPEVFNPATRQWEEGYRAPFDMSGTLPLLPKSVAEPIGGSKITSPPPDSWMDKLGQAMPLLVGGFAGAAAGGLGGLSSMFNGGAAPAAAGSMPAGGLAELAGPLFAEGSVAPAGFMAGTGGAVASGAGSAVGSAAARAAGSAAGKGLMDSGNIWGTVASIAGPVLGGLIGSNAASSAADTQASAADRAAALSAAASSEAIGEQRRQFDTTRADLAPYREAGTSALSSLKDLMSSGSLTRKFTLDDFWSDPVTKASYQSGLDLGTQAINNMAGARGSRNSGATLKALNRFGTDYTGNQAAASQQRFVGDQANEFNKYSTLAGVGQTATNTGASMGANTATNIGNIGTANANTVGNLMTGSANARGAAAIAGGNALSSGINSVANWYNSNDMLNKVLASRTGGQPVSF